MIWSLSVLSFQGLSYFWSSIAAAPATIATVIYAASAVAAASALGSLKQGSKWWIRDLWHYTLLHHPRPLPQTDVGLETYGDTACTLRAKSSVGLCVWWVLIIQVSSVKALLRPDAESLAQKYHPISFHINLSTAVCSQATSPSQPLKPLNRTVSPAKKSRDAKFPSPLAAGRWQEETVTNFKIFT